MLVAVQAEICWLLLNTGTENCICMPEKVESRNIQLEWVLGDVHGYEDLWKLRRSSPSLLVRAEPTSPLGVQLGAGSSSNRTCWLAF